MNKNYIDVEMILKYAGCGGYDGTINHMTPEQTAFGMYLYALGRAVDLRRQYSKEDKKINYVLQGKVDMLREVLDNYARKCMENKVVKFDARDFKEQFKNINEIVDIAPLMPYYIHFFAVNRGVNFSDNSIIVNNTIPERLEVPLVKSEPISIKQMKEIVGRKIEINRNR